MVVPLIHDVFLFITICSTYHMGGKMTNVTPIESKLEALERELLFAEQQQRDALVVIDIAICNLEYANHQLAEAIKAIEGAL